MKVAMNRLKRVVAFLMLYAQTKECHRETFLLDLFQEDTFNEIVWQDKKAKVEYLSSHCTSIEEFVDFKNKVNHFLAADEHYNQEWFNQWGKGYVSLFDEIFQFEDKGSLEKYLKKPEKFSEEEAEILNFMGKFNRFVSTEEIGMSFNSDEKYDLSLADGLEIAHLVDDVDVHLEAIDDLIAKYAKKWKLDRMISTDLTVLRLGVYEIVFADADKENYQKYIANVIDDYVEIIKHYSSEDSYGFINGVLDTCAKEHQA